MESYIHRNRPAYSEEELSRIYAIPHRHDQWEDHVHRVERTIAFARRNALYGRVADLSCGDGTIALALSSEAILGDFAPGYPLQGPIDETIKKIPFVDVFILSETLEHLDTPVRTLQKIRNKTRSLLLTTPVHPPGVIDENPEHYWTWNAGGVESVLNEAHFSVIDYEECFNGIGYTYGIWMFI